MVSTETKMGEFMADMKNVKSDIKDIKDSLKDLPTKSDLADYFDSRYAARWVQSAAVWIAGLIILGFFGALTSIVYVNTANQPDTKVNVTTPIGDN